MTREEAAKKLAQAIGYDPVQPYVNEAEKWLLALTAAPADEEAATCCCGMPNDKEVSHSRDACLGKTSGVGFMTARYSAPPPAPGSPTCRVCGWPFVSPHYPPCTGHEVPWKDVDAVSESVKAAITEFRGRCNEFAFFNGDDEWLDAHQAVLERAIRSALAGEK